MRFAPSFVALLSMLVLGTTGGCAKEQKKVEAELASPGAINCATAAQDIQTLQREKASIEARVLEGATAVYPGSAIIGLVAGVESTKIKVATGDYNSAIDARIAEIKQTCGDMAAESP